MTRKIFYILLGGAVSGVLLSLVCVNPIGGSISLTEAVMQFSGARGPFPLNFVMVDLLNFMIDLLPSFLFEMAAGIALYQHFCTASIYVFSRTPKRIRWYAKELSAIAGMSLLFQAVLLAAAFLVTAFRYEIQLTQKGAELLLGHFVIYSLWIFSMAVLINLLALFFGSSSAFIAVYSIQICLILSFWFCHFFQDDIALTSRILRANPASRLVMGWMGRSEYGNLSIPGSILLMGLIALGVSLAGGWIVKRKELLISNIETGGM